MGFSRITLRGETSLNLENNQALIILDGVPISSKITGTGFTSHLSADSPVDYGPTVSDLNPDDIENVTVLKGPGATYSIRCRCYTDVQKFYGKSNLNTLQFHYSRGKFR